MPHAKLDSMLLREVVSTHQLGGVTVCSDRCGCELDIDLGTIARTSAAVSTSPPTDIPIASDANVSDHIDNICIGFSATNRCTTRLRL